MKAINVSKTKATIEFCVDELYRISEALDVTIIQHKDLDRSIVPYSKESYQEVHEELTDMIISITDNTGGFVPS